jgi:hypothetical protein
VVLLKMMTAKWNLRMLKLDPEMAHQTPRTRMISSLQHAYFATSHLALCTRTLSTCTEHMHKAHGLFIPDQQHLIDLDSFLGYLSFLISEFHECLYCESIKGSPEAAKHHMTSKGHCRINFEGTARWEEFYDYPEDREHVVIKSDSKRFQKIVFHAD